MTARHRKIDRFLLQMEAAARSFFSSPRFAVVGASQNPSKFGYKVFAWYHTHGLPVTPINPGTAEIKLPSHAYKTVASPAALDDPLQTSLSVITPPAVTKKIVEEAKRVGVRAVWLQPGSFDDDILEYTKANFEAAVGGAGGRGGEGWCVLADGDSILQAADRDWNRQKL